MAHVIKKPVEILRDRLREVEESIQSQLTEIEWLKVDIATLEGDTYDADSPRSGTRTDDTSPKRRVSVMPALESILEAEPNREFHARELVTLLEQRGILMQQVNPENTVATAMSRLAEKGVAEKLGGNRFKKRKGFAQLMSESIRVENRDISAFNRAEAR